MIISSMFLKSLMNISRFNTTQCICTIPMCKLMLSISFKKLNYSILQLCAIDNFTFQVYMFTRRSHKLTILSYHGLMARKYQRQTIIYFL